ncbi:hypothetical protein [Brachybacterium squillarum]|uniref:hypothetical protein n=1 Tax=Brachybacterium squillarum TaxID=661979 RepID=UPI002221BF17|nr:hypothetical protein [Brachybacterium squillarum]MCW1803880.1 hypothetical protein [Brachybacterium squillarum]
MGYAFGKAPLADGTGTTPEDVQQWLWSLYRSNVPSIARGGVVSGTSSMAYDVAPAALIIPQGDSRRIVALTDRVTVPTTAAPSSGSRVDIIYAGSDGAVKVGTSLPANNVMLDRRTVPAGITATTATTSTLGDRRFAPLVGASMGRLISWEESVGHGYHLPAAQTTVMNKTITLEEDRLIDWRFFQTLALEDTADGVWSSVKWDLLIDGAVQRSWEMKVENIAETKYFNMNSALAAGTHVITLRRAVKRDSKNTILYYKGASGNWPGTNFSAVDIGAIA